MPTDPKNIPDEQLLVSYKQNGSIQDLGTLYNRYTTMVYGVCLKYLKDREESKDAVMQIFEKLVALLRTHDIANFKSWLYVTARNYCLMQLRSSKGRRFEEISQIHMESGTMLHLEIEGQEEMNYQKLERCIEELGVEQRTCVQLFYLQQKCYREITEETGYEDNKVKSYIQNGKRNLKLCMERNG
jgi:RNA polymerase sigma factor (sigma-70 family)